MKLQYYLALALVPFLCSCVTESLYTKEQYLKMSDEEIRSALLSHVPLGSTKEEVELFIKRRIKSFPGHIKDVKGDKFGITLVSSDGNILKGIPYQKIGSVVNRRPINALLF